MEKDFNDTIVDLGSATELTKQFSEGEADGSPTSPGLNLKYPPAADEASDDAE